MYDAVRRARIAHVSQQCLHEKCPQMREKEQWPPSKSLNLNIMELSCLGSNARSYFETFIQIPEQFLN